MQPQNSEYRVIEIATFLKQKASLLSSVEIEYFFSELVEIFETEAETGDFGILARSFLTEFLNNPDIESVQLYGLTHDLEFWRKLTALFVLVNFGSEEAKQLLQTVTETQLAVQYLEKLEQLAQEFQLTDKSSIKLAVKSVLELGVPGYQLGKLIDVGALPAPDGLLQFEVVFTLGLEEQTFKAGTVIVPEFGVTVTVSEVAKFIIQILTSADDPVARPVLSK